MSQVFEENSHVRHRIAAWKRLVHVCFPGEPLDVPVLADADKALAAPIVAIPEILHHPENPEHAAVFPHEGLARFSERSRVSAYKRFLGGLGRQPPAQHRVVDPFAGSRRHNARGVAREHDVATVIPAAQRLSRNWRSLAAERRGVRQTGEAA